MEIRQLRSFQVVANLLSFNKAADRLHYAQSTISAQIRLLEQELGADLFERLGKNVQLTETGAQLLQYANKILDLVDETASELTGNKEPVGSLTVRIPESFGAHWLPDVIRKFHSKFPKVRLSFITCSHEDLARDLRKGITDLAFLLTESIAASDILTETLGFEKVVLVASSGHPLAARRTVRTRDLAGETILLSKVDCSYRKTFEQILSDEGLRPLHNRVLQHRRHQAHAHGRGRRDSAAEDSGGRRGGPKTARRAALVRGRHRGGHIDGVVPGEVAVADAAGIYGRDEEGDGAGQVIGE